MYDEDRSATAVADWNKFKPDILLVRCKQGRRPPETVPPKDRQVHIVEIKYCRDTDTTQQSHKAELQHQDLKAALLRVGYTEDNIHVHVIVLGVAGTIYRRKKERLPPNEWRLVEEGGEHGQYGLKAHTDLLHPLPASRNHLQRHPPDTENAGGGQTHAPSQAAEKAAFCR
jgi:hypothetical protein